MKPKLYSYWRSSAAFRVRIALNLKGMDYEVIPVHLGKNGGEQLSEAYENKNPNRLVPLFDDGKNSIHQSLAIIEYLDEIQAEAALLPSSPIDRAWVRSIAMDMAIDIHPISNLRVLRYLIKEVGADLGITVDPDVDRLAMVCEDGSMFGEEYTLVAVSDYVLSHTPGSTVSNMSSTKALRDITEARGLSYFAAAVGEVNVVTKMKAQNAVIGGEGNGGIIYPASHYGRDALVGIALFLTHLAKKAIKCSELRDSYPSYTISKNKIELTPSINVDAILSKMAEKYKNEEVDTLDGVKIYIGDEWVHLRKSNTEPIIRIYSESNTEENANKFALKIMNEIKELC
jgi:glutathione S-transferase